MYVTGKLSSLFSIQRCKFLFLHDRTNEPPVDEAKSTNEPEEAQELAGIEVKQQVTDGSVKQMKM